MSLLKLFRLFHPSPRTIFTGSLLRDLQSSTQKPDFKKMLEDSTSTVDKKPEDDQWFTSDYPGVQKNFLQSKHAMRPKVDPTTTSVFLFPGQGSQFVGMAKDLISYPNVKEMFECASEILRYNLLDLCLHGPEDMLNMTVHSQVAVMVASLAAVEKMRADSLKMIENCVAAAGFSVGEYTALVFAGALEFENAVRLLKIRGEAMQAASDLEPGGMMTVFLHPEAKIKQACSEARDWLEQQTVRNPECRIASYLFPDCKVISGHMEALKFLESHAKEYYIKRMKYLPVSGAFHSKLMEPAKKVLKNALNTTHFEVPIIPVYSNMDSRAYRTVKQIQEKLAEQLCSPVMWEQTMHVVFERDKGEKFPYVFECGPGISMKTILKYNNAPAYRNCTTVAA